MNKRTIIAIFSLFLLGFSEVALAQDPNFTQFYANPLYLNPAFAGALRCPRLVMNYRNQWPGNKLLGPVYQTYSASYDQHIDAINGGLGILVTQDNAGRGTIQTLNASAIYSYQVNITRTFSITAALQATYFQKSLDWSKLYFGDQIDAKSGFIYPTQEVPGKSKVNNIDFSAGLLGFSKRYFFGFAAHHITQPNEGFIGESKLPLKITGHAGAVIPIGPPSNDVSLSPNILFKKQQNFQELNIGLYVQKGPIVGGLWYRNQDSFIMLIGFQQEQFRIGYSYDVTVSKLTNSNSAGSHEISMSILFPCHPKKKKFRTISCPSF